MDFVLPNLAVGNRKASNKQLQANGITHVLRVCHETPSYTRQGLMVMLHATPDNGKEKEEEYWRFTMAYGKDVLAFPGRKLYVHCAAGMNRGPASVYAILRAMGYTKEEAFSLIRKARPKAGTKWWARQTFLPWYGKRHSNFKAYQREIDDILEGAIA